MMLGSFVPDVGAAGESGAVEERACNSGISPTETCSAAAESKAKIRSLPQNLLDARRYFCWMEQGRHKDTSKTTLRKALPTYMGQLCIVLPEACSTFLCHPVMHSPVASG